MNLGATVSKFKHDLVPWSAITRAINRLPSGSLHLFILFNLAIAQPLFEVLARSAPFFVAERSQPIDIILLLLLVCVLLPSIFLVVEVVAGLVSQKLRVGVHTLLVAVLLATIALPAIKRIGDYPGIAVVFGAGLIGIVGAAAYLRFDPVRQFLTFASIGVLVIPAAFILNPDISKLVFPNVSSEDAGLEVTARTPVVMVIFDEFPLTSLMDEKRQIDPVRYPNFASLADDAYWFRNATTVTNFSTNAVPAILTGLFPSEERRLPILENHPNNLFTLLGNSYEMRVFESITSICPATLCSITEPTQPLATRMLSMLTDVGVIYLHIVFPDDMNSRLPPINQTWHNFVDIAALTGNHSGGQAVGKADRWKNRAAYFASYVDSIENSDVPRLYLMHIEIPHPVWNYLPSGKSYESTRVDGLDTRTGKEIWVNDDWVVTQGFQRHLLQVGFADKLLGDLLDRLKNVGIYERALVIVVADHGASFRAGDYRRNFSPSNLYDILPIPLFVKLPHQDQATVSDRNVQTVDIVPTIAEVLNVALPWRVDGRSLFDTSIPDRTDLTIFDGNFEELVVAPVSAGAETSQTLARKLSLFGSGERLDGLYRIGRYRELIGQDSGKYLVDDESEARIWLYRNSLRVDVDPESEFVPARVRGQVDTGADAGENLELAVAINGTIRAVTRTFVNGQEVSFSAIVPETAFRKGYNHVELFVVSGPIDRPRLQAPANTRTELNNYSFSKSNGRETITTSEGQIIPIIGGTVGGTVEQGIQESDAAVIIGWAADLRSSQPAEFVLVVVNGEIIHIERPNLGRPDVAMHFGKRNLVRSGFRLVLPSNALGDPAHAEVRLIALSSYGVASELTYAEEYTWGKRLDETEPAAVQLSDLESGPQYSLSVNKGGENIVASSGQIIPIVSDTVAGYVDFWSINGGLAFINGWAADVRKSQQVKSVLLFANGQFVSARETSFARPDVAKVLGNDSLLNSGFDFVVPLEQLGDLEKAEVRVFAITKDQEAQELAYFSGYPWAKISKDATE